MDRYTATVTITLEAPTHDDAYRHVESLRWYVINELENRRADGFDGDAVITAIDAPIVVVETE